MTGENVHGGALSLKISSPIEEAAYFSQYVDFPYTTFTFGFWILRGELDSVTACYLIRDYDGNTARAVSTFEIHDCQIKLAAWDNMGGPGRQMFDYNVTVGDWHHVVFVANGTSRTQEVCIDGSLVTTLNSSSGDVFVPEMLSFGDVSTVACNGTFYFDDLELTAQLSPGAKATISIVPPTLDLGIGRDFVINVGVENIEDLYSWELKLYYLSNVVNCTDAVEGDFLGSNGGNTLWVISNEPDYNATHGLVRIGSSLIGAVPGVGGGGTLASISFHALELGNTSMELLDSVMLNSELQDIVHDTVSGFVHVRQSTHDIAVSSVFLNKDAVGQSYNADITVTVENQGDFDETFNVTVSCNSSISGMQMVTNLAPDNSVTLTFVWNTTGVSKGYYSMSGAADNITTEQDLADNILSCANMVCVGIPGDVNGDHEVNMRDIAPICRFFMTVLGDPQYVAAYDITNDGKIDMKDVGIAARNFGMIDS